MYSRIRSLGIKGIGGYEVELEVSISSGLPRLDMVGLPDAAVKEAADRVRAAVKHNGWDFPVSRITVNLAPADTKKAGTVYDLPVLLGILTASGQVRPPRADDMFFGELSLTGQLRPVSGALPMALAAEAAGRSGCSCPVTTPPRHPLPRGWRSTRSGTCVSLRRSWRGRRP